MFGGTCDRYLTLMEIMYQTQIIILCVALCIDVGEESNGNIKIDTKNMRTEDDDDARHSERVREVRTRATGWAAGRRSRCCLAGVRTTEEREAWPRARKPPRRRRHRRHR